MKVKEILPICQTTFDGRCNASIRKLKIASGGLAYAEEIVNVFVLDVLPEWVYEADVLEIRSGWPLGNGAYDEILTIII